MSVDLVTSIARRKMLLARAGEISLPPIAGFAYGNGGVDAEGNIVQIPEEQIALNCELLRKAYDSYTILSDYKCRYLSTLTKLELAGESISEIALYDTDGDLVYIKHFYAKGKDSDLEMEFQIDDIF